jgi:hypothetical protein
MTIREYISDINNSLKGLSLDSFIPPKWIYLKTQNIISDFLKKDNSSNKLIFKLTSGWAELNCVEMKEVPITTCDLDVYVCQKLMKSKHRLPEFYETKFGGLIRSVSNVDYSNSYEPVFSAKLWKATQKREFKAKKYYFIQDGYLYIPIPKGDDSNPEVIRMELYPKNMKDVDNFNIIQGCGSCKKKELNCKSPLDYILTCPDYLINDVKKETINQILSSYSKINKDDFPNLNTNEITNQKNIG